MLNLQKKNWERFILFEPLFCAKQINTNKSCFSHKDKNKIKSMKHAIPQTWS